MVSVLFIIVNCYGNISKCIIKCDSWLLLLAKCPNVQDIVYNELANNGKFNNSDGALKLSKVKEFAEFWAFIFETLRIGAPAPDGLPRFCDKDIRVVW